MNAIQFIKEHGVDKAREVVDGAPENARYFETYPLRFQYYTSDIGCNRAISISDLKHLVESMNLVEKVGGISQAKYFYNNFECVHIGLDLVSCRSLGKAIADYEAIYSGAEQ